MLLDIVQAMSTVKSRFTDTRLLRTPHYDEQFALSLGKESPYIVSNQPTVSAGNFCAPLIGRINRRLTVYIN